MKRYDGGTLRQILSTLIFWLGMGGMAILAIPAALFLGGIALIWCGVNAFDRLLAHLFP